MSHGLFNGSSMSTGLFCPCVGDEQVQRENDENEHKTPTTTFLVGHRFVNYKQPLSEVEAYKVEIKERLKQYDRKFEQKHGRRPTKVEKEPVRHLYNVYRGIKDQHSALSKEEAYRTAKADLQSYMADIYTKLKHYETNFQKKYGRVPTTDVEKEPVLHLYKLYETLEMEVATLDRNFTNRTSGDAATITIKHTDTASVQVSYQDEIALVSSENDGTRTLNSFELQLVDSEDKKQPDKSNSSPISSKGSWMSLLSQGSKTKRSDSNKRVNKKPSQGTTKKPTKLRRTLSEKLGSKKSTSSYGSKDDDALSVKPGRNHSVITDLSSLQLTQKTKGSTKEPLSQVYLQGKASGSQGSKEKLLTKLKKSSSNKFLADGIPPSGKNVHSKRMDRANKKQKRRFEDRERRSVYF